MVSRRSFLTGGAAAATLVSVYSLYVNTQGAIGG
jgi:hypothetical protein